ncbi:MAG: hypothetical protein WCG96_00220 [Actinomycetes bacterium]
MFAIIRHYTYEPENHEIIDSLIRGEFRSMLSVMDGFHEYYWLETGHGEGASVGIWEDRASADLSTVMARSWVKENLSAYLSNAPDILEGDI